MEAKFQAGQMVCLRAETARQGSVIQILPHVGGRHRYKVFHSAQEVRDYYEEQLLPVATSANADPITQALRDGQWLPPEVFRARVTVARLAHPLAGNRRRAPPIPHHVQPVSDQAALAAVVHGRRQFGLHRLVDWRYHFRVHQEHLCQTSK